MSSDASRPSRGAPPIGLDNPPPDWTPDESDEDQEIGVLILVRWEIAGTKVVTKTVASPPYRRRYAPWLAELFRRIGAAERDRVLNRAMKPPATPASPEPPTKK